MPPEDNKNPHLKKLPSYPVELRIIEKSIPGLTFKTYFNFLSIDIDFSFETKLKTEFRVMDEEGNTYFIGNTGPECEMWIEDSIIDE